MRPPRFATCVVLLALSGAPAATARAAGGPLTIDLQVRVYDQAGIPDEVLAAALGVTDDALSTAAVRVDWVRCTLGTARCRTTLGRGELSLRLVERREPGRWSGGVALGDARVDTHAKSGVLATVYVDRVRRLAADSRTAVEILLGRVIAHEMGHLLLGTAAHSRDGLMRAHWSPSDVQRQQERDWVFTARERDAIHARALVPAR